MSEEEISMHEWFGILCPMMALVWLFLSVWDIKQRVYGYLILLIFGFGNLWLYVDNKKKQEEEDAN